MGQRVPSKMGHSEMPAIEMATMRSGSQPGGEVDEHDVGPQLRFDIGRRKGIVEITEVVAVQLVARDVGTDGEDFVTALPEGLHIVARPTVGTPFVRMQTRMNQIAPHKNARAVAVVPRFRGNDGMSVWFALLFFIPLQPLSFGLFGPPSACA